MSSTAPITDSERAYALDLLRECRQRLHQLLANVSSEQEIYKPGPDRWSIADCVEHITLVETGLAHALQSSIAHPAEPARRSEIKVSDVDVLKAVRSRTMPITAPSFSAPTGRFGGSEAALQAFDTQRDAIFDFLQTESGDLRTHYFVHRLFGTLDLYQVLLLMAAHVIRHSKQIEEVKADAGFPPV
ncbi:DinB family protein [Spirosoma sp. KUDC1026]|uniref:DinB family protein n=1 Tax=Spirosoma sp. KUDC1026 TaxID=2745947 RepID=UPI00159B87BE|nr:DinB family protein [Spirosoma sp. KUDC1026]QKZ13323.1 DinB family protein [Spirosoma sp. KUDC1026]